MGEWLRAEPVPSLLFMHSTHASVYHLSLTCTSCAYESHLCWSVSAYDRSPTSMTDWGLLASRCSRVWREFCDWR